jgi:hypothetical protein
MQDTHDLDQSRLHDPIVENVDGRLHFVRRLATTSRSNVKAPNPGQKVRTIASQVGRWFGGNQAHRGCQECSVPAAAVRAPPFGARFEDAS